MAKKYVETYSSPNAAVQYPEKSVHKPGYTTNHKEKIKNCDDILHRVGKRKKEKEESGQT